jgi:hypothetical protein
MVDPDGRLGGTGAALANDRAMPQRRLWEKETIMPLFHFNSQTGDRMLPDLEGEDLPDFAAARSVAMTTAREALLEAVKFGDRPPDHILVTDGEGREVMTVDLSDLLRT